MGSPATCSCNRCKMLMEALRQGAWKVSARLLSTPCRATTSQQRGHLIEYVRGDWQFIDTKLRISDERRCKHCGKLPVLVRVKIPADLARQKKAYWKRCSIDACISRIVRALQRGKINMRGSCCGHGDGIGDIHLQDGRMLIVLSRDLADAYLVGDTAKKQRLIKEAIHGHK